MTTELKPCPFCGANAKLKGGRLSQESYTVWCENLHKGASSTSRADAIAAWNTRTTSKMEAVGATPSPVPELVTVAKTDADELRMCAEGFATAIWINSIEGELPEIELVTRDQAERIIADHVRENAIEREATAFADNNRTFQMEHAEAAEAKIADREKEIERLKDENRATFNTYLDTHNKVTTLEVKLAEIEKPVPSAEVRLAAIALAERSGMDNCNEYDLFIDDVAKTIMRFAITATLEQEPEPDLKVWIKVDENKDGSQEISITETIGFSETPDGEYLLIRPNAHPVADREAETIERGYGDADELRDLKQSILQSITLADFTAVKKTVAELRALSGKESVASPLAPEGGRE